MTSATYAFEFMFDDMLGQMRRILETFLGRVITKTKTALVELWQRTFGSPKTSGVIYARTTASRTSFHEACTFNTATSSQGLASLMARPQRPLTTAEVHQHTVLPSEEAETTMEPTTIPFGLKFIAAIAKEWISPDDGASTSSGCTSGQATPRSATGGVAPEIVEDDPSLWGNRRPRGRRGGKKFKARQAQAIAEGRPRHNFAWKDDRDRRWAAMKIATEAAAEEFKATADANVAMFLSGE